MIAAGWPFGLCLVAFAAYAYDTAATRGLGKVHRAIRHNCLDGIGDVAITETFDYAGKGGRVSFVLTANSFNDLDFLVFQTYDALGRARDLIYPTCLVSSSCPSEPLTVRSTYTAHDLTAGRDRAAAQRRRRVAILGWARKSSPRARPHRGGDVRF